METALIVFAYIVIAACMTANTCVVMFLIREYKKG